MFRRGALMRFRDRADAGRQLGQRLRELRLVDPVVLALPRGGVPVAFQVARVLGAPLDVIVVRKLGVPFQPELGMGAVGEDGVRVINPEIVDWAGVSENVLAAVQAREQAEVDADEYALRMLGLSHDRFEQLVAVEQRELDRRVERYRRGRDLVEVRGRDVVLIDDGLATGVTAEAALRALRARRPRRLILAVPACAPDTAARLDDVADEVVCLVAPADFVAVGKWYANFGQTDDDEVLHLLDRASDTSATAT